ncbi:MAG TPA: hypothetical protein VG939_14345, partial [Caulobacteraceae bacterium]|nr:hypothetical protein [Caulobacteraceae bacterium]
MAGRVFPSPIVDRRAALAALAGTTLAARPAAAAAEPADPTETVRLWPGQPPGAPAVLPREEIADRIRTSGFQDRYVTG